MCMICEKCGENLIDGICPNCGKDENQIEKKAVVENSSKKSKKSVTPGICWAYIRVKAS